MIRLGGALLVAGLALQGPGASPAVVGGLTAAAPLAAAYESILDADFARVASQLAPACPAVPAFCRVMEATALWWEISLEPDNTRLDASFGRAVEQAIAGATAWTVAEPARAEAWFARGAAYGVRAQWRVARDQRLAAARDGKQIKDTLERALALDPALHDAKFGLGLYRYYAEVGPAALRFLRWLLLLPGGDRAAGLRQMQEASVLGRVVRGEADYQLHRAYLWYENRSHDALAIIQQLQVRYPHNPLFALREAEIHDRYFNDAARSAAVLRALVTRAEAGDVHAATLAIRRARAALDALARARRDHRPIDHALRIRHFL